MKARPVGLSLACLLLAGCNIGTAVPDLPTPVAPVTVGTATPAPGTSPVVVPTGWRRLAPAPIAVSEVAGAGHAGEVWTAGGFTADGSATTAVSRYVPRDDAWLPGPDLPVAVHHAALVSTGRALHLLGGYEGADFSRPTADVWVLEDELAGWQRAEPLPQARAAGAAAFDGEAVVYGGGVGPQGVAADVWRLAEGGWEALGALSTPREHLAAAGGDAAVWFMGGRVSGLDTNLGRVDLVADGVISDLGDVLPPAGGVTGFATSDGRGCMAGGEDPQLTSAVVACVDRSGGVTRLPDLAVARHGLAAAEVDGVVYLAQGGPEPGLFTSDVLEALELP